MPSTLIILSLFACGYKGEATDPAEGDWDEDGYTGEQGDCANENPDWNPGAEDTVGDDVDQNCDLADGVDEDGDGHANYASGGDDCDDTSRDVQPGAPDEWYDGIDSDCAGDNDFDRDLDGHDSDEYGGDDCDDGSAELPRAESWNQMDDDCDGCIDEVEATVTYEDDVDGNPWMVISFENSDPHGMWLGLAQTAEGGAGWYGEDCLDGTTDCHPLAMQGGMLQVVQTEEELTFGATTLFDQGKLPGSAAVYWDSYGACTAIGTGSDYYDSAGCCVQDGW